MSGASEGKRERLKTIGCVLSCCVLMLPMMFMFYVGYPHRLHYGWSMLIVLALFSGGFTRLVLKFAKPKEDGLKSWAIYFGLMFVPLVPAVLFVLFAFRDG